MPYDDNGLRMYDLWQADNPNFVTVIRARSGLQIRAAICKYLGITMEESANLTKVVCWGPTGPETTERRRAMRE